MDNFLILERLDRLEKLLIGSKEVLTLEETCDYTRISRSYLYKLTTSGKIPVLQKEDTNFLYQLTSEIPAFLFFLKHRTISSGHTTRMWFTTNQIKTKALINLVKNNRNRVEKELATILLGAMEQFEMEEIYICPLDALQLLNRTRIKTDLTQLRRLLKRDWKLENKDNSLSYQKLLIWQDASMQFLEAKGRYFTVTKKFLHHNFDETMTD